MSDRHAGDCSIYMSLINDRPEAGICTCGYGWELRKTGDWSQVFSKERQEKWRSNDEEEQRFGMFDKRKQKMELRRRLAYIFGPLFRQLRVRNGVLENVPILVEIRNKIVELGEVGIFSRRSNYLMHQAVHLHERRLVCYWGKFYEKLYGNKYNDKEHRDALDASKSSDA